MTQPPTRPGGEEKRRYGFLSTLELHELDDACRIFAEAFTAPYLVGSAGERPDFRDVDVRLILPDERFDKVFGDDGYLWALICKLGAYYLRGKTGLPVDFQIQRQTQANERFGDKTRNPLGLRKLGSYAGMGDATAWFPHPSTPQPKREGGGE